jgi:hypothetical protein
MPSNLLERREAIKLAHSHGLLRRGLWRDTATLTFPSGKSGRSRALYWLGTQAKQLIDEYGEIVPGEIGAGETFNAASKPTKLFRLVNKNQLVIHRKRGVSHLSPANWTLANPLESELYQIVQQHSAARASAASTMISALIAEGLGWNPATGAIKFEEQTKLVREKERVFRALSVDLQKLLVVLDSNLGSAAKPLFFIRDRFHPTELNFASPWRCYVYEHTLNNVLNTFLPPAIFSGFDIYGRPVFGRRVADRVDQYCVVELKLDHKLSKKIAEVDYFLLLNSLDEFSSRAVGFRDACFNFFGGVDRYMPVIELRRKSEFLFRIWDLAIREVLIEDDHEIVAAYSITIDGDIDGEMCNFSRSSDPFWRKGKIIDDEAMLRHWYAPRVSSPIISR